MYLSSDVWYQDTNLILIYDCCMKKHLYTGIYDY